MGRFLAYDARFGKDLFSKEDAGLPHNDDQPTATQARRDFLRRFFHDLATPLSAVSLHLEGADRRARKGTDPTDALATARSELTKAFDLFEMGRESLLEDNGPSESLDFDALVGETAASLPGVRIEGRTGARVRAPRRALSSALSALAVNAVEAAGAHAVQIRSERADGLLRAVVQNPGDLTTNNPETLFSPKAAKAGKSWGMGLARARLAAADAGGSVRLENREGQVVATLEVPEEPA
jgi:signal transduction histidine kinase